MSIRSILKTIIPEPIKQLIRPIRNRFVNKYKSEMSWWRNSLGKDNGIFSNNHYARLMLAMAEESDDKFLSGKIVADFGCGPRGSLVWAKSANLRIGIDVLADHYADEFKDNILSHGMIYLKSTEHVIPLPSNFVDALFTLNAMDHVDHFSDMCEEIIRVLKPGGLFIGGFNLEEPASPNEPQQLTEKKINENLLEHLEVQSYRLAAKGPANNGYAHFFDGNYSYIQGEEGFLWVKARKAS